MRVRIEPLGPSHDRAGFDCGRAELNDYLRKTARQHQDKDIARSFVMVDDASPDDIVGFFTLTVCEVDTGELPKGDAKKYPRRFGGVKIARLAVSNGKKGKGIGSALLADALWRILNISNQIGLAAVLVDATDENAAGFYLHHGFRRFPDNPLRLFQLIENVRLSLPG